MDIEFLTYLQNAFIGECLLIVDLKASLPALPTVLFLVVLFYLQLLRAYTFSQILAEERKGISVTSNI